MIYVCKGCFVGDMPNPWLNTSSILYRPNDSHIVVWVLKCIKLCTWKFLPNGIYNTKGYLMNENAYVSGDVFRGEKQNIFWVRKRLYGCCTRISSYARDASWWSFKKVSMTRCQENCIFLRIFVVSRLSEWWNNSEDTKHDCYRRGYSTSTSTKQIDLLINMYK